MGLVSTYSNNGLYKTTPYRILNNLKSTNISSVTKEAFSDSLIVVLEVPENAVPFTILCETPTSGSDIIVLTEDKVDIVDKINERFMPTLVSIRNLHEELSNVSFNLMGYFFIKEYEPDFTTDNIWFYDLFVNDNWVDFPLLKTLLSKENIKLNILPEVYFGKYDEDFLQRKLHSESLINKSYTIDKLLVKNYLELYNQSYRSGVAYYNDVEVVKTEITFKKDETKEIQVYKDDVTYEKVKTCLDKQFKKTTEEWTDRIINAGIFILEENKNLVFHFIKTNLMCSLLNSWCLQTEINKIDPKVVEKEVGHYAFLLCREHFNFFNNKLKI